MPERTMLPTPCDLHAPAGQARGATCPCRDRLAPSRDSIDTMLETLARLARFGLDAEGRLLVEGRGDR